jgi:hypothetical protein
VTQTPDPPSVRREPALRDLDSLVVNTELTLISIIQGIALYWLTDSSRHVLVNGQVAYWPYVVIGLLFVLLFWSRALIHTLTVIRWPLEFGHNFLYIACTFIQAVMFTQIADPQHWYLLGAVYTGAIWILVVADMRLIRRRFQGDASPQAQALRRMLSREQNLHIYLGYPAVALFYAAATAAMYARPDLLIAGGWHVVLALALLASVMVYLVHTLAFFRRITPLILASRRGD